ncbi:MAG: hypothetical protein IIX56_01465, partial [Treponema sp.]|nr:hypothetical protein [Treponema sp.]
IRGHFALRQNRAFQGSAIAPLFVTAVPQSATTATNNGFAALTIPCPFKQSRQQSAGVQVLPCPFKQSRQQTVVVELVETTTFSVAVITFGTAP